MTRNERLLKDAKASIDAAYGIMRRIEKLDRDALNSLMIVARQANQAAIESNQLIGALTNEFLGSD